MKMKITIKGFEVDDSMVVNPDDYIPEGNLNWHRMRPWLIHNEYGPMCIVFAHHEGDALDQAVDSNRLDSCLNEIEHATHGDECECSFLGNASEPFDLTNIGIVELPNPKFSFCALLAAEQTEKDT